MIAMGNSGDKDFIPHIKECLNDEEPLVRAHAAWALWKIERLPLEKNSPTPQKCGRLTIR